MVDFREVWQRIKNRAGEKFHTIRGLEFTYRIEGDYFVPSRTNYRISSKDFKTAFDLGLVDGPGEISKLVRGPSYVWAVLHDKRIREPD